MKKYFAAAAVAVMVFAFAAMANSFDVYESVLASGEGDVNSCAEELVVESWGAEMSDGTTRYVRFEDLGACEVEEGDSGLVIFVTAYNDAGGEVGSSGQVDLDDVVNAQVRFEDPYPQTSEIDEIRVLVHTKTDA